MSWNVRGLCNPAKRGAVAKLVSDCGCNIICLQETKLAVFDKKLVSETLGARFQDNFIFHPANGTRGGMLIACSSDFTISADGLAPAQFSLSGTVTCRADNRYRYLSNV